MKHAIVLKLKIRKSGKISFLALSPWIFKILSKCEKVLKPCRKKEFVAFNEVEEIVNLECRFVFSNNAIYLKNRDTIKDKIDCIIDKTVLHKKVEKFKVSLHHESSDKADFAICNKLDNNNSKRTVVNVPIQEKQTDIALYYLTMKVKILTWNVATSQLKVKNNKYGSFFITYKKDQKIVDQIVQACTTKSDINITGLILIGGNGIDFALEKIGHQAGTEGDFLVKNKEKFDNINVFGLCQK